MENVHVIIAIFVVIYVTVKLLIDEIDEIDVISAIDVFN
jgi:hypothetical protein